MGCFFGLQDLKKIGIPEKAGYRFFIIHDILFLYKITETCYERYNKIYNLRSQSGKEP